MAEKTENVQGTADVAVPGHRNPKDDMKIITRLILWFRMDTPWEPYQGVGGRLTMRRRVSGLWQHRSPTEAEKLEWWESGLW